MNNLKRAAYNISSRFGLLNSHRSLMVAISEERQVQETILKLVLARVNASTSLLRWAKKEENQAIKDCICRLYDISLMYASVQRKFAEQCNLLHTALKDILQCEVTLEALRKNLKDVTEKKERLHKSYNDGIRKKIDIARASNMTPFEEVLKLQDEEEQLKKVLEDKTSKAQIFKSKRMKQSLNSVCDAHLKFAEDIMSIFNASKKVIDEIDDEPNPFKDKQTHKLKEPIKSSVVSNLAKELNISKPIASNMTTPSPIFHVELGRNRKLSDLKGIDRVDLKKSISKPVLQTSTQLKNTALENAVKSQFNSDFVIISNTKPPTSVPPPVPGHRRRAKTIEIFRELSPKDLNNDTIYHEYDEVETDEESREYFELDSDNTHLGLYRSASDSTISKTINDYSYCAPWENYHEERNSSKTNVMDELKAELGSHFEVNKKGKTSELLNEHCDTPTPIDMNEKYASLQSGEEILYSQPSIESNSDEKLGGSLFLKDIYENTATQFAGVEYVDNNLIQEPIKSKLEMLDQVVKKNIPKPKPRPDAKEVSKMPITKRISSPILSYDSKNSVSKRVKPRPKPRLPSSFYDPPALDETTSRVSGNVREMVNQMSGKIQPASLIPSMTQAKLREQEEVIYQNNT